ncbi:MAG: hypothetical protein C0467_09390 [Planctomycetaceae bacterium]|nr:hypothetical protein [Planctomycetaceae bacterium]
MSVAYELMAGTICFTTTGDVEHRSALDTLQEGLADAAQQPVPGGWHLLFDIRKSTENRDPNELRNTATAIAMHRAALSGRCAVVATDPLHYGLARMFGVFMSGLGFDVNVCNNLEDAKHWLNPAQHM